MFLAWFILEMVGLSRVLLAKIQYTHDDQPTIFCINQDKNIDNKVYYICIKFSNLLILLTTVCLHLEFTTFMSTIIFWNCQYYNVDFLKKLNLF